MNEAIQIIDILAELGNEEALKTLEQATEMIKARPEELFCEKINKE